MAHTNSSRSTWEESDLHKAKTPRVKHTKPSTKDLMQWLDDRDIGDVEELSQTSRNRVVKMAAR